MGEALVQGRGVHLKRAVYLTLATLGWNVVEGIVAITAALASGSAALLAFGIDSFVESSSATVMLWRLSAERGLTDPQAISRLDRRAQRLIGASLFVLATFALFDAGSALIEREQPAPSLVGLVITSLSLLIMMWLARAKRRTATALDSRAMETDAFQTTACWWLSLIALCGIGLNAAFGWWWADPVAALGMVAFLVKEGREAWRGDECCVSPRGSRRDVAPKE